MQIDIKAAEMKPLRNTYGHIAERFGDKAATRYQEATYDLQATDNFHYRPFWEPELELIDPARTAVKMKDWYAFKDPRQFYYGTYVQARAKMHEAAEQNFSFVESRQLLTKAPTEVKKVAQKCMVPLRHLALAANMNNSEMTAKGYGTVTTQATMYCAMDHLGIAQYLSRIGLVLDENTGASLAEAKQDWMDAPYLQGLRKLAEDLLCQKDWFELFVAQNFALDGLLYPLVYGEINDDLAAKGGTSVVMLSEFMSNWMKEINRWVDAEIKVAAAESAENKALLEGWVKTWSMRAFEALEPLAKEALGDQADQTLAKVMTNFNQRAAKCGLSL